MTPLTFRDIVPDPNLLSVKAVWGFTPAALIVFAAHGDTEAARYSVAKRAAQGSFVRPFVVTIAGGADVPPELEGRALELIRITGVYGPTRAFLADPAATERLSRWPVAVAASAVYRIAGAPHLVKDLGLENRRVLTLAFDRITAMTDRVEELWKALATAAIEHVPNLNLPGFADPQKLVRIGTRLPAISIASEEGKKRWRLSLEAERDSKLGAELRRLNREENGGHLVCDACGFCDELDGLFDAHHMTPIAAGIRTSSVNDLRLLCPTCHRWAHKKAATSLYPLSLDDLRKARRL